MISIDELYEIYIQAKKFLNLNIEEARSMPFLFLMNLLFREIERLKKELGEEKSEEPRLIEEEVPQDTLSQITKIIKDIGSKKREESSGVDKNVEKFNESVKK